MQVVALLVAWTVTVEAVALFARTIGRIVSVVRLGQPAPGRTDHAGSRTIVAVRAPGWSVRPGAG